MIKIIFIGFSGFLNQNHLEMNLYIFKNYF